MTLDFTLNGSPISLETDGTVPLIHLLRNDLGFRGTRFGCGQEQCGACTLLVDDAPAYACTLAAEAVAGKSVRTIEGRAKGDRLHAVQEAFLDQQAGQCGYCLSGSIMSVVALIERNPGLARSYIVAALDRHLCRCGAHARILRAVERAVSMKAPAHG